MMDQDIDHINAVLFAAPRRQLLFENCFLSSVVPLTPECEFGGPVRLGDRPSCKRACDSDNVLLSVSAIDAHRMELHQLAGIVLVEARPSLRLLSQESGSVVARRLRLEVI